MRAVITVVGRDTVGIIAQISNRLAQHGINILDITQSVLEDIFAMVMLVEISKSAIPFASLVDELSALGEGQGLRVHTMHEDIFNSMHRI